MMLESTGMYARTVTDHHFGSANVSLILGKLIGTHMPQISRGNEHLLAQPLLEFSCYNVVLEVQAHF